LRAAALASGAHYLLLFIGRLIYHAENLQDYLSWVFVVTSLKDTTWFGISIYGIILLYQWIWTRKYKLTAGV
jgi:hypothetical protein